MKDSEHKLIQPEDLVNFDGDTIFISIDSSELNHLRTDRKYKFEFEGYVVTPPPSYTVNKDWNNISSIPLKIMQGYVNMRKGNMVYLALSGLPIYNVHICNHCLKSGNYNTVCNDCINKLGIRSDEDIKNIKWSGWVPVEAIRSTEVIRGE